MLVPVLEITVAKGSNAKEPVAIELMTSNRRITGLSTTLEFYQKMQLVMFMTRIFLALF